MIVELTGIPGAGKSTVIRAMRDRYPDMVTDIDRFATGISVIGGVSRLFADFRILMKWRRLTKEDTKLLRETRRILAKSGIPFVQKANIYRNVLKKLVLFRILQKEKGIFVVDEGVTHIPMSLFVDGKTSGNANAAEVIAMLPRPDMILVIDEADDILFDRVMARGSAGHRRMDFSDDAHVRLFMQQSRSVLEEMKRLMPHQIYVNSRPEIDTENIMQTILHV